MQNAMQKLNDLMAAKNCRLVAGLDPVWENIPMKPFGITEDSYFNSEVFRNYCMQYIDSIQSVVPAIKINIAFFEQYGLTELFFKIAQYAKIYDLFVIGDIKRADIGNTSAAYAATYLQEGSPVDAITVNPYFGTDGIKPFLDLAKKNGKGIFVLVKTSNKSSSELQDLELADGRKVYEAVADLVKSWGEYTDSDSDYSLVGAVVGATHPEQAAELRKCMPNTFFLVPGFGAQGGTADGVIGNFDSNNGGAIVNSSRGIMCAINNKIWKEINPDQTDWTIASAKAAQDATKAINDALNSKVLL